jgi:hypothetical protein
LGSNNSKVSIMKLTTKILIALGAIVTAGLLAFIAYQQFELKHQQDAIQQQVVLQKQLSDQLMRSQSQYATTKDIQDFIKNNNLSLQDIKDDLGKLHAEVSSVNQVVVNSKGVVADNVGSTGAGKTNPTPTSPVCKDGSACQNADPFGYMKTEQKLTLNEPFGSTQVPIGSVGFSAWQDKPWSIDVLPREYVLNTVVGLDENQRQYFYNKFSVSVDGKTYSLPITQAKTEQVYPMAKFSWWNPRLFLGADGGLTLSNPLKGDFVPNVDVGFMSYGKYKNNPDFSILELGVGYAVVNKNPEFILTPITYNVGKHVPLGLMNNTYLGPSVMLTTRGAFSIMAGIRVGL